MINALILLTATFFGAQDKPTDIPKKELPKAAVCVVCTTGGEEHGEEKPAAGVRYKGKSYYFCNIKEVAEFKKDPEAFMPRVLPRPMPKLNVTDLAGKAVTLDDYKDKVVLIDFWATWCVPCVKAMPDMEKLYAKYKEKGLVVLGVSIDEETEKVPEFLKKKKFTYPILLDSTKEPSWANFKVRTIPAIFLVDKNGQIIDQWMKADHKKIEEAVKKATS